MPRMSKPQRPGPTRTPARRSRPPAPAAGAIRRLPLGSLRVFVAVAEHLSFTRAADALGVTTSAVSMQIQSLEEYLRVALFRRDGRQILLTSVGQQLLPRIRQGLSELERALNEARAERGTGPPHHDAVLVPVAVDHAPPSGLRAPAPARRPAVRHLAGLDRLRAQRHPRRAALRHGRLAAAARGEAL